MDQYLELPTSPLVDIIKATAHSLQRADTPALKNPALMNPSLMKKCRGASWLISRHLDGATLSTRETIQLRTHLMVCRDCRQCLRQFTMLHRLGDQFMAAPHHGDADEQRQQAAVERARQQLIEDASRAPIESVTVECP